MSDPRPHPLDALHDAIDGRLGDSARAELAAHLESCESCRREFEMLSSLKRQFGARARAENVPPAELEVRLRHALDEEDRRSAAPTATSTAVKGRTWKWAGWVAAAAAALVLTIIWSERRPVPPAPEQVAADFRRFTTGALALDTVTSDVAALERRLNDGSLEFDSRVFDFGMMDYRLTGGGLHQVSGQRSALFAYAGPAELRLLCQMFEGLVSTLPPPADRRTNDGIEFFVYREGEVTVVFWQEGDIVCALAANGDAEAAVRLAFAKAVRGGG